MRSFEGQLEAAQTNPTLSTEHPGVHARIMTALEQINVIEENRPFKSADEVAHLSFFVSLSSSLH